MVNTWHSTTLSCTMQVERATACGGLSVRQHTKDSVAMPADEPVGCRIRDVKNNGPVETDQIVGLILEKSREHGIDAVTLIRSYTHLKTYEARRVWRASQKKVKQGLPVVTGFRGTRGAQGRACIQGPTSPLNSSIIWSSCAVWVRKQPQ